MLTVGHFGKQSRNTWKVLKCGAGEGWLAKTSWTDRVRSKEVLLVSRVKVKAERNILGVVKRRKAKLIGYIFHRNGLLKHSTGGNVKRKEK
jgi:hypothetical protein